MQCILNWFATNFTILIHPAETVSSVIPLLTSKELCSAKGNLAQATAKDLFKVITLILNTYLSKISDEKSEFWSNKHKTVQNCITIFLSWPIFGGNSHRFTQGLFSYFNSINTLTAGLFISHRRWSYEAFESPLLGLKVTTHLLYKGKGGHNLMISSRNFMAENL
jgi:hypothetical protein